MSGHSLGGGRLMTADDELHRRIVESSLDGLWVVDACGRTLFANRRVGGLLGRTDEEVSRTTVADVLEESDRSCFGAHLADLRRGEGPERRAVDRVYLRADGTPVPLSVSEVALYDDTGALIGYAHRLTDDTRRRTLVGELTRSRSQLAEAQAIARIGSWETQNEPYEVTWSEQMFALLDVDPQTFRAGPEGFASRVIEEDRPLAEEAWDLISAGTGEHSIDVRIRLRDGSLRWVRAVGRELERGPNGKALRVGGTVQDITSLKETELRLRYAVELNTLMQFVATAANETNTLDEAFERTRELLLAHPDWERGVGFDVVGDTLVFRPVGEADPFVPTRLERAVAYRALAEGRIVFEEEADPEHPLIAFPVLRDEQPVVVAVITNRSPFVRHGLVESLITQVAGQLAQVAQREADAAELAAARDLAMAASQTKSEFLATMSHEIRTPLKGVIGLNDLLLRTELDPKQQRLASGVQVASRTLLGLINDILDFSKIEAGRLELERLDFEVRPLLEQVAGMLTEPIRENDLDLVLSCHPDAPAVLSGDPTRLAQVVTNLVANAVKFTERGGVVVRATAEPEDGRVRLRVEVSDTGVAVRRASQPHLFEPFTQADSSTTRIYGGT